MHNVSNLFYFGNNTLHVLDGISLHHQKSKTVHTASYIYIYIYIYIPDDVCIVLDS